MCPAGTSTFKRIVLLRALREFTLLLDLNGDYDARKVDDKEANESQGFHRRERIYKSI